MKEYSLCSMAVGSDPNWETHLTPKLLTVAECLSPRRNRLPAMLFSEELINLDNFYRFTTSTMSETDLALDILAVLRMKGQGSFNKFCDVLLEIGDDASRHVEKLLRPNRQEDIGRQSLDEKSSSGVTGRQYAQGQGTIFLCTLYNDLV